MKPAPAHPSRRVLLVTLAGAAAAAPLAGCGRQPRTHTIEMRDMAFGPAPEGLRVGDTIEWVNADMFQHTATAKDGSFDVDLAPKARGRTVLKTAGSIAFYCRYHPGMQGVLAVGQ
jgi:plastocyanin